LIPTLDPKSNSPILNQRISILGCGWLGLALGTELAGKGYSVAGSSRSAAKMEELVKNGINPYCIDISDKDADLSDFLYADILIVALTSKNIEDIKTLVSKVEASQVQKVVFVSSTSVYPYTNGVVTEETETLSSPLVEIETVFTNSKSFATTVIRFGGLFGYDRMPGKFIKTNRPMEHPEGYVNLIHRDDCIRIIESIIVKGVWNEVLNACADSHPNRRAFYIKEAEKIGLQKIRFNETSKLEYKIINSNKMIHLLNYAFKYSDLMNYH